MFFWSFHRYSNIINLTQRERERLNKWARVEAVVRQPELRALRMRTSRRRRWLKVWRWRGWSRREKWGSGSPRISLLRRPPLAPDRRGAGTTLDSSLKRAWRRTGAQDGGPYPTLRAAAAADSGVSLVGATHASTGDFTPVLLLMDLTRSRRAGERGSWRRSDVMHAFSTTHHHLHQCWLTFQLNFPFQN